MREHFLREKKDRRKFPDLQYIPLYDTPSCQISSLIELSEVNNDPIPNWKSANIFTLRLCARGKAIRFCLLYIICLSAQKSSDLDTLASEQSISTTKQSKMVKKLTCVCFELHSKPHRHYKSWVFCWPHQSTTVGSKVLNHSYHQEFNYTLSRNALLM